MIIPRPSYVPMMVMSGNLSLGNLANLQDKFAVGVGVFGSAAAYALVWELGSKRLKKPGPKTMWGVNRFGEKRIFSKQAPKGYVYINADAAQNILTEAVDSVDFDITDLAVSKLNLEIALDNAAHKIARMISDDAPVDSGDLRSQIQGIDTDEQEYLETDDDQGTLFI